jgi:hypothetical protein
MQMVYGLCVLVAALAVLASPTLSFAVAFPFVDVNNNGVYDPGVDSGDITAQIQDDGVFYTSQSLVIPVGSRALVTKNPDGFVLIADKNITVNAPLTTANSRIMLISNNGSITVGDGVKVSAAQLVKLDAQHDIVVGSKATLQSASGLGMVMLYSEDGNILFKEYSTLYAPYSARVVSDGGLVTVRPGSALKTGPSGLVTVSAAGDVCVQRSQIQSPLITVLTKAHLLEFQNNQVQVPTSGGLVHLVALGSTVDITGTTFKNLDASDLVIEAGALLP